MSVWITTFCRQSVASVTPEQLREGIAGRLQELSRVFCPDAKMSAELTIESTSTGTDFGTFLLRFSSGPPIEVERWHGDQTREEVADRLELLEDETHPALVQIRNLLTAVQESIGFDLKVDQPEGMRWPVALAAAAWFAEMGAGAILVDGYMSGWWLPKGKEVDWLVRED